MGWFSKIFKGSNQRLQVGNPHSDFYGNSPNASSLGDEPGADADGDERHTHEPSTSGDTLTDQENEDIDHAIALSLLEENQIRKGPVGNQSLLDEDEQLARAIQESLIVGTSPRHKGGSTYDNGNTYGTGNVYGNGHMYGGGNIYGSGNMYYPVPVTFPMDFRICAGCNMDIGHGRFLNCLNGLWHPECFRCYGCNQPISDYEFSTSGNYPFHKACYRERYHPKCDVCSHFIPTNPAGLIEYRAHPFWIQKYCPSHEHDGTPRCCSCERMEPRDTGYVELIDRRKLCLECLESAVMDTNQCQPLYLQIQEFYEGLDMKVEQEVPLLLVQREALNEAREGEKNGHYHMPETRGLCLSEEQTVSTVLKRPRNGRGNWAGDMVTEPYKLTRQCEVTAILILFGLPRLLTGSILAHEMMHAWMRLKGFRMLSQDVEEGICQVLAHKWLESELAAGSGSSNSASSSSSSSSRRSKKGPRSHFERKLGEFFKHQLESDASPVYGDGFRAGRLSVQKYGLRRTLEHIQMTGRFPI
ncbi:PREDICTED: protein DA1 isoform X2 [Tarenaya hassleriana]|nr:PREDICTED: protein DA1 isoform X2 [Tarenaya hassleriana]XP_010533251.1 PREDICTED: protein DA1 isoform X2 [Tarenaya hassleriana]